VRLLRSRNFPAEGTGYELNFRERFIWLALSVKIGMDFWADEAVERYWIENVTSCKCAD
jgi:hypothetical protein